MPEQKTMSKVDELERLAEGLTLAERYELAARLLSRVDETVAPEERFSWTAAAGIAPYPLLGEDAQEWVTRTRRESDEDREEQWRR